MRRTANPCAKTVTPEYAYEVWRSFDATFTYWVLKKYQTEEYEKNNPFARWYVWATSPAIPGSGEYGDMYVEQITKNCVQINNPLCRYLCIHPTTPALLQ